MNITVKKFGGTSVGTIERIQHVAQLIADDYELNPYTVVVVSAMGRTTDEFFKLAYQISDKPSEREMDMLLTAGERISMSLLSIALHKHGIDSISFTGSQSGIITDAHHGNARIINVSAYRLWEELEKKKVVIVAGFQGVSQSKEVTTLGRGGSDTTAVALACYLDAANCEIYTDVPGIFTADPNRIPNARKIDEIDFESALTLAYRGCSVIHPRAVEYAMDFNKAIEVKSSMTNEPGTLIKKDCLMEQSQVTAITTHNSLCFIRLDMEPNYCAAFMNELDDEGIDIFHYAIEDSRIILLYVESGSVSRVLKKAAEYEAKSEVREGISAVTFVGKHIWNNMKLLGEMMEEIDFEHDYSIVHSFRSVTIFVQEEIELDIAARLHEKFLEGKK